MSATSVFLSVLLFSLALTLAIYAYAVRLGFRWTKLANLSFGRALFTAILLVLVIVVAGVLIGFPLVILARGNPDWVMVVLILAAQVAVPAFLVARTYQSSFWRGLLATLPLHVVMFANYSVAATLLRTYLYEAYYIPTNAMAPTILGEHFTATCPNCGHLAYGSPMESPLVEPPPGDIMICGHERKAVYVTAPVRTAAGGDRILVSKLNKPRRWDIIVFRVPSDPSVTYVKRLVGLPGEELFLRDGAVWINGERQDPPDEISGIEYLDSILEAPERSWTANGTPVQLGPGEYFVLGDFSARSADSRYWTTGAPGHPPFAVPEENILGVAICIYWPIARWRAFR
jgi:signal peptidase I